MTHAHPEGMAGAIAVAVAAAVAAAHGGDVPLDGSWMLATVHDRTPESETRRGLARAIELGLDADPLRAARVLGSGAEITAMDTVPLVVWSAASAAGDYESAFWRTVAGLGDRDTTCAMVGGIVVLAVGLDGIPREWRDECESLPAEFRCGNHE